MRISCIACLSKGLGASIKHQLHRLLWNGPGGQHYEHQLQRLFLARGRGVSNISISIVCLCTGPGGQHHEHQLHCVFV